MAPPLSNCSPTESLRSATEAADLQLAAACDMLIASLAERYEDDVTVILARIPESTT